MILQKSEIQDIINKKCDKKGSLHLSEVECLNLIETYIFYKKGIKVGDITPPTLAFKNTFGKIIGTRHLEMMHIAVDYAWSYFVKELNESFTEEGL